MRLLFTSLILLLHGYLAAQSPISIHKLGVEEGLHDGTVRCIGQDRLGYIWIGTVGALNRFDGTHITHYTHIPGDGASPYGSQPRSICTDLIGRLWIGFENGLMEFDLNQRRFKKIASLQGIYIGKIVAWDKNTLFLATTRGLIRFNPETHATYFYTNSKQSQHAALTNRTALDLDRYQDQLYVGTSLGLSCLDVSADKARSIEIPLLQNSPIVALAVDQHRFVWLGTHQQVRLVKLHPDEKQVESYDRFLSANILTQPLNIMDILVDKSNRTWVATAIDGLLEYNETTNQFTAHLHQREIPSSPSGNNYRSVFQDNKGVIWLGCDFAGVNFFQPNKSLFNIIQPFPDRLDERSRGVARAVTEDQQGNIWMGNHDGVSRFNPFTNAYTTWRNEEGKKPVLYTNLVRSMYCDRDNNVWIGTSNGVNKFNSGLNRMEFIPHQELPDAFYNSITADRENNIWFCHNKNSTLHWYSSKEKRFYGIDQHPVLKTFQGLAPTSYVLEDSKNRLWISLARKGIIMYDKKQGSVRQYQATDTLNQSITGNQVIDIKEAPDGRIWISSLNGITAIDVPQNKFQSFDRNNGLPGNWAASLMIDSLNRVWAGVNGGLVMINPKTNQVTRFSKNDGLPSLGFSEHAAIALRNGNFVFPSYHGYVQLNPMDYQEEIEQIPFYLERYAIFDKEHYPKQMDAIQFELKVRPAENSFTFHQVALHYINPKQTWFAYQLGGFEKEWHVTQDGKAVYTNVPGGKYKFVYKASSSNSNWNQISAKEVQISIQTIFYKQPWFWILCALASASAVFWWYKRRIYQQDQLFQLQSKAQALEKEKATVMFENLKQQLNPHFLFNSLTSLAGLIEADKNKAGIFLQQMSDMYRYILKSGERETVPLKEELQFVQLYVDIQKTRFGNGLQMTTDIPTRMLSDRIAPATLQNMVENAIKHNIVDDDSPLHIALTVESDYLLVRNNLQKKKMVETSNKTGLKQFTSLYQFLTERPVIIEETTDYFTVRIPLI